MGPPPAVAACRTAVRAAVADLLEDSRSRGPTAQPASDGPLVLVAASGGPDSTALLDAACVALPPLGLRVGAVTVDHGLQPGSAERARTVAVYAASRGADPVTAWHVVVDGRGGPEAAARAARRKAFAGAAAASGAVAVLLGHTLDDQAETVLLGLVRGSGARSLAGMATVSGLLRRPFLELPRAVVAQAAASARGEPALWDDPHNADPAYTRVRVRHGVLPVLEAELGPGVAAALARTATLLRMDADALEGWAGREMAGLLVEPGAVDVVALSRLPAAVRTRVLRRAALDAGAPASDLTARHVAALDALATRPVAGARLDLPGRLTATRRGDRLVLTPAPRRE